MKTESQARGKILTGRELAPSRVLVVDEEALVRWSLCAALAAEGFDAVSAAGAPEAERLAAEEPPPRVAIIDAEIEMHGHLRLARQISRLHPGCRVVLMTTAVQGHEPPASARDGFAVIEKPFDLGRVVRLVAHLSQAA